ncbi:EAL domain-containing protein [Sulfuricurvum sp.]|uniref:sensor domain-containing protein n=1 Tax=Sulfuricurvum sp. TaxID=2025608 RepID=UPI002635F92E|nr:EAL domain-containing protein [Sulfuricurvum sp.]MDD4884366.1 EAL domain-containing protein [Sulfuricurvum sp.]
MKTKEAFCTQRAFVTAFVYFVFGTLWILFSDNAVELLSQNNLNPNLLQTYKGVFYVFATSILLYFMVLRFLHVQAKEYAKEIEALETQNRLRESLEQTEQMYHALFDNMLDSVAYCRMIYADTTPVDYQFLRVNPIFESVTGIKDPVGRKMSELIPNYARDNSETLDVFGEVASSGKSRRWEHYLKAVDKWFSFSIYSLHAGEIIVIASDVSAEKKALQALKNQEEILERTSQMAKVGGWEIDPITLKGRWTAEVARIHDLDIDTEIDVQKGIGFYTENSKPIIAKAVHDAIKNALPYDLELEIISAKGVHKWVRTTGNPIVDNSRVVSVRGVMQDITVQKLAQIKLDEQHVLLETIINSSPDAIFAKDREGKYILFNEGAAKLVGIPAAEVIGKTDKALFSSEAADALREIDRSILESKTIKDIEEHLTAINGESKYYWATKGPLFRESGELLGLFGISRDITERKNAEINLLQHKTIFENLAEGVYAVDTQNRCTYINNAALHLLQMTEEEVLGQKPHDIFHHHTDDETGSTCLINDAVLSGKQVRIEDHFISKEGNIFPVSVSVSPIRLQETLIGSVITFEDITQQRASQAFIIEEKERFDYMAHHDPLTDLPNRFSLLETLKNKMGRTPSQPFALLFLDLDGFKEINDSYGHPFGDALLIHFTQLLHDLCTSHAFLVRSGGDEFVILTSTTEREKIKITIGKLVERLSLPFLIDGTEVYITASIGISFYPEDADTPEDILKNADAAMYNAKRSGKNTYSFFDKILTKDILEKTIIATNLKKAIANHDLLLHYQSQIDPQTNRIIGIEALVRWIHDEKMIPPTLFIPIAEERGLIVELGAFILEQGFSAAQQWADMGILPGRLAINVSARQLTHPNFFNQLVTLLQKTACNPEWIELEITESSILEYPDKMIVLLEKIKNQGFKISIDDFGTGYSSLSYLKNLPVDKLKIDISFIRNITHEPKNQSIVKTIIALAKGLGMCALAEGVESSEELQFLSDHGIDSVQGFYYYHPISKETLHDLLIRKNELSPHIGKGTFC